MKSNINYPHHNQVTHHKKLLRFVCLSILIIIALSFGAMIQAYAFSGETDNHLSTTSKLQMIDVGRGETLWSIASAHAPKNEDTRSYINKLMKVNGMKNTILQQGQILYLP
jgi:cell division protein YceG involved in septum cleavage